MGTPLGVERGEERRAQAVLGEDMPSKRRMARMVLVGGEKEARGEVGPSCCWDQCCNNTGKYTVLSQTIFAYIIMRIRVATRTYHYLDPDADPRWGEHKNR